MNLNFLENKYFLAIFAILSGIYGGQIRPTLPKFIMDLFQNPIFRVLILFLVVVRSYKDIQFSLIISMAFLLITNQVNEQLCEEKFTNIITDTNMCNDVFLENESLKKCINTVDNYSGNFNNKNTNLSKLRCMYKKNHDKISTTCQNAERPLNTELNINCVEQYKLKPTYDIPNVYGNCQMLD
jgi:hypothetical protein